MAEPSAIWSNRLIVFDRSIGLTQNVILSHGRSALHALISRIDALHRLTAGEPGAPVENTIFYHEEIAPILSDLCFQQGVASTVLFNDGPKAAREDNPAYRLRQERLAYVQKLCSSFPVAVLSDRKIRNRLTHLDEYLAKEMRKPNTGWFIDMAFGSREVATRGVPLPLQVAYCRTYIVNEDIILNLDGEISLRQVREEVQNVLAAIWHEGPEQP